LKSVPLERMKKMFAKVGGDGEEGNDEE
jgi:hypothetical protein